MATFITIYARVFFTKFRNGAVHSKEIKDFSEFLNGSEQVSFILVVFLHSSYCRLYNYSDLGMKYNSRYYYF